MESKRTLILQWIEQGVLDKSKSVEALSVTGVLPDGRSWRHFIENLLLWLGGMALSFSVLFFIAYNWSEMGRFAKFALVEVLIVLSLIVYWKLDADKVIAKVSITSATILLGVLLALYGQTYQTGADPWQLFANWALLILPWVLVAHFAPLWLIWVALLNLSIMLYFQALGSLFWFMFRSPEHISWVLFIFNSIIWITWEFAQKRFEWLSERWPVRLIALTSGSSITFLMVLSIFDHYSSEAIAVLLYFAWAGAVYFVYYRLLPDLFMLASLCFSAIVVVTAFFGRHLLNHGDLIGGFFILTLVVIAMAAAAAKWLKSVQKEQSL